jgi:LuxR family maltose regulon positive regulatory protein
VLVYLPLRAFKVVPPQPPAKEVKRPRLLEMLDQAIERPVTVISAGPGSGKTVLVNQWARACPHAVIWVSLNPEDDREERFWTLIQYALHQNGLLADSSAPDPSRSLAEQAINDLADAAARADGRLVLVLDDVHILSDADVISTLDAVLMHPPP